MHDFHYDKPARRLPNMAKGDAALALIGEAVQKCMQAPQFATRADAEAEVEGV